MTDTIDNAASSEAASLEGIDTAAETLAPETVETSQQDKAESIIREVGDRVDRPARQSVRGTNGQFSRPAASEVPLPPQEARTAPIAWRADMREKFSNLLPEVQDYILERETHAHGKISELGQGAKDASALSEVTQRYQDCLPEGMPAPVMVEHLLAAHKQLESDPAGSIRALAESYGLDLSDLAGGRGSQGEIDHAALAEIHEQAIADARQEGRMSALVDHFANSSEHWGQMEAEVYAQVIAIKSREPNLPPMAILQRAYAQAARLNEGLTSKRVADEKAEQSRKASEAKRLSTLNVKSGPVAVPRKGNWEDTLRSVGERVVGGR